MIEILLHGLKMDPLVSLHYYAPVCAVINLLVLPFTEGLAPFYAIAAGDISWGVLVSNALVAFLLNIAAVFLVGSGSGLVLTLAGVFKVGAITYIYTIKVLNVCLCPGYSAYCRFGACVWCAHNATTNFRYDCVIDTHVRSSNVNIRLLCRALRTHLIQDVRRKIEQFPLYLLQPKCLDGWTSFRSDSPRRHVEQYALVMIPVGGYLQLRFAAFFCDFSCHSLAWTVLHQLCFRTR